MSGDHREAILLSDLFRKSPNFHAFITISSTARLIKTAHIKVSRFHNNRTLQNGGVHAIFTHEILKDATALSI
ncbi:MAG TPA: hypothetical protein DG814_00455 [Synechococcus sp. UBA9887]|nr:hypothetical protein [Synechococcus sp. UBA9887]